MFNNKQKLYNQNFNKYLLAHKILATSSNTRAKESSLNFWNFLFKIKKM